MTGSFISAWLLFSLLLALCSLGGGLLVSRVCGGAVRGGLAIAVGFALTVTICAFFTSFEQLAPASGYIAAAVALVGFALALTGRGARRTQAPADGRRGDHRARDAGAGPSSPEAATPRPGAWSWVWQALAAAAAFVAVGAPALLTGTTTWAGYTRIVDIGFQMDFANHLALAGRHSPPLDSSYNVAVQKLTSIGYPGGGQATLGAMAHLLGLEVAWCYQPFLAFVAAIGALAIFSLLGHATRSMPLRALGAAIAIQPNLLYAYSQEGGIKELTTAALLMTVAAVLAEGLPGKEPRRAALPAAVAVSAAFAAFSVGIAPWLGLLLAGLFALNVGSPGRRLYKASNWLAMAVVAGLLSLPGLVSALKLATIAGGAVGGVVDLGLGNLAAPVPDWSSAGVWLTGDYRYPLVHVTATHAFGVLVIVAAVAGIVLAAMRRRWALAVLGASAPVALYYWIAHTGPWIEFKAYAITGVLALTLAFAGAGALASSGKRLALAAGWLVALAVAGVVLYGNAITYHDTTLAPAARYRDLAAIGHRYAGRGPTLFPAFDEYAEYFLREERVSELVNPAFGRFPLVKGTPTPPGGVSFVWDLNQIEPTFLQSFPLIVVPRSPTASRAPSNYDLVERTRYFDVWRRDRPTADVIAHMPLTGAPGERTPAFCRRLTSLARKAGPGTRIAYSQNSMAAVVDPTKGVRPDYWKGAGGVVLTVGAGSDESQLTLPSSGRFAIWLNGSVGRPLTFYLDGRRVGEAGYEERYPNQFVFVAGARLSKGAHVLRFTRPNGSLHPGSGDPATDPVGRTIGAIAFEAENGQDDRVHVAPASQTRRICAAPAAYQWLELLRPGGAPRDALPVTL